MANKAIYKITISNWEKYNGSLKSGHKKIMISTGFLTDAKIRMLTPVTRLLYLSCLLVAGELTKSQIEVSHESLVFQSGVKSGSLQSQLDLLQSLQLVTYSKSPTNIIEEKIKEDKVKEKKGKPQKIAAVEPASQSLPATTGTSEVIAFYCDRWRLKYNAKTSPHIGGKVAGLFKTLVCEVGKSRSLEIVENYLEMPDPWFLTKRHDVPTLILNLNAVTLFADTGKLISKKELRDIDNALGAANLHDEIERGAV